MDLLSILRARCDSLPAGDYTLGLNAVVQHIAAAERHLARGREQVDESAFTDVIYRTNQAFEGAMKEAYRVLTARSPARTAVAEIESFLTTSNVLRPLVLAQLRIYRKDWRNESTHDYRLAFDEDEALLAIASVCVFAIVLVDQITEKLHFLSAKLNTCPAPPAQSHQTLDERVVDALEHFQFGYNSDHSVVLRFAEALGALGGYLSASFPDLQVRVGPRLRDSGREHADVIIGDGQRQVLIEFKLGRIVMHRMEEALLQAQRYMSLAGIDKGIVFGYGDVREPVRKVITEPTGRRITMLTVAARQRPA
jgi:hypothetical protein